jgi:hypothetical protein
MQSSRKKGPGSFVTKIRSAMLSQPREYISLNRSGEATMDVAAYFRSGVGKRRLGRLAAKASERTTDTKK